MFSSKEASTGKSAGATQKLAVFPITRFLYNRSVLKPAIIFILLTCVAGRAQQQPSEKPQVKVNYLNVCSPSTLEQGEIKAALAKVQIKPAFSHDFEVSRGQVSMKDAPDSKFVRLRRDFAAESPLMTAQYSISNDPQSTIETLVLRTRDAHEFHELALEDRVTGSAPPASMLTVNTPVSRILVERLGKSSVVLSRCEGADQSTYEPLFQQASAIMAQYRKALELNTSIHLEIAWLGGAQKPRNPAPK